MRPGGCEISWSCMFVYITRRSSLSMEKSKDDFTSYFDNDFDKVYVRLILLAVEA